MKQGAFWVRRGDEEYRVEIAGHRASVDEGGSAWTLSEEPGGVVVVEDAGGRARAIVVADGAERHVFVAGDVYEFEVEPVGARRRTNRGQGDQLTAPMPARVVRLLAAVGQEVKRGDVVITLEAMKMELPVRAPRDGRVLSVACDVGQLVQPGVPLMELS
jgi:biotin carboxyl carrier protein